MCAISAFASVRGSRALEFFHMKFGSRLGLSTCLILAFPGPAAPLNPTSSIVVWRGEGEEASPVHD